MKELLRTNNAVYLSYIQAVLTGGGISFLVFDSNMSIMEGSIGVLPRRVMVPDGDLTRARTKAPRGSRAASGFDAAPGDAISQPDRFLGGRVIAAQQAEGFRAGHDTRSCSRPRCGY